MKMSHTTPPPTMEEKKIHTTNNSAQPRNIDHHQQQQQEQQQQQQQQQHTQPAPSADWQNLISSSLKTTKEKEEREEANSNNSSFLPPSPIPKQSHNQQNEKQEAPWTRWSVEARLAEQLMPVEKIRRQDERKVVEETRKFAMHVPRSPQIFSPPPGDEMDYTSGSSPYYLRDDRKNNNNENNNNNNNKTTALSPRNQQQQDSTWESENFQLRQRVASLEEQITFFRKQVNNYFHKRMDPKRRKHLQYLAKQMELRVYRDSARKFFVKWNRYSTQTRCDSLVKDARNTASKQLMESSLQNDLAQQEMDIVRKQLISEQEKNKRLKQHHENEKKILNDKIEELLAEQWEQQEKLLEVEQIRSNYNNNSPRSPYSNTKPQQRPSQNNNNNTHSSSTNKKQNMTTAEINQQPLSPSPISTRKINNAVKSPYARVNESVYAASVSRKHQQQEQQDSNNNNNIITSADGNTTSTTTFSDNSNNNLNLENRIEQLSLRCLDQDEVIRTLFVELAAVGKELESTKRQLYENNLPDYYTTAEAASMLLRQSVDGNVSHAEVESVVSSWPRLRQGEFAANNHNNNNNNNNATSSDVGSISRIQQQNNSSSSVESSISFVDLAKLFNLEDRQRVLVQAAQLNDYAELVHLKKDFAVESGTSRTLMGHNNNSSPGMMRTFQ